ncbi:hypothetical protein ABZ920_09585 [Streptomyces sp. NPDC046831]|uniref:hypothetical protein n=1 Tax=Streptomyces sp. NPDC046831 TaxID=3154805 RepID=UPI0033F726FF
MGSRGDAGRATATDEGAGDTDDSRPAPPSDGPQTGAPANPGARAGDAALVGEVDTAGEAAATGTCGAGVRDPLGGLRVRGRHRRPRHRKVLLAAGGLALAAGALSLVRLAPESGVGGLGAAEAEPQPGHGGVTHGSVTSTAAVTPGPADLPPTAAPFGGGSSLPVPGTGTTPAASWFPATGARPSYPPGSTPLPEAPKAPHAPAPGPATRPPATSDPEPRPTPTSAPSRETPGPGTHSPAPPPGNPGLCLPVIGLCVDLGLGGAGH